VSTATATLKMILLGEDKSASKVLHGVGEEADKSSGGLKKFGKAAAAGLAVAAGAALAFGKESIDAYKSAAIESGKLARTTGLTVEAASQLRFAGEATGVTYASLSTGMKLFGKNLGNAAQDTKLSATMVDQLGFSFKDAQGNIKPMSDLLPQVSDRFANMADGPKKTALAMKLFGRGGADMLLMLNKGSEGLAEFAAESDRTGNTLKDTDALSAQLKAQRAFSASISGLKIQLGQALIPILTAVALFLTAHVAPAFTQVTGFVSEHGDIVRMLVPVLIALAGAFATIALTTKVYAAYTKLMTAYQIIATNVQWAFNAALAANPIGLVVIAIAALVIGLIIAYKKSETFRKIVNAAFHAVQKAASVAFGWVKKNWPLILAILTGPIGLAVLVIAKNWDRIKSAASAVLGWVKKNWPLIIAFLTGPIGIAVLVIAKNWDRIKAGAANVVDWIRGIPGKLRDLAGKFRDAGGHIIGAFLDGLSRAGGFAANFAANVWGAIKGMINSAISMINGALPNSISAGPVHIDLPDNPIPYLARGTRNFRGGMAVVGERGPELVGLPRGSDVFSNADSRQMLGGAGGNLGTITVVVKSEDGRVLEQKLARLKRTKGGARLEFETA
jgi:phage-related protein